MASYDREALIKEASALEDDFKFLEHLYKDDEKISAFLKNFDEFDKKCLEISTSWYSFMNKHRANLQKPPTAQMLSELSVIIKKADNLMKLSQYFLSMISELKNNAYGREHKALMSLSEIIDENRETLNFVLSMRAQLNQRRKVNPQI